MRIKFSNILLIAKYEILIFSRMLKSLIFFVLYESVFLYFLIKQKLYVGELIKPSTLFLIITSFMVMGLIYNSSRGERSYKFENIIHLLTAPINVSDLIFGKSKGVCAFSVFPVIFINFICFFIIIIKTGYIFSDLLYVLPIYYLYSLFLVMFVNNFVLLFQMIIGISEGSRLGFFIYMGLYLLFASIMDANPEYMNTVFVLFPFVLIIMLFVQYFIFNKILPKKIINFT